MLSVAKVEPDVPAHSGCGRSIARHALSIHERLEQAEIARQKRLSFVLEHEQRADPDLGLSVFREPIYKPVSTVSVPLTATVSLNGHVRAIPWIKLAATVGEALQVGNTICPHFATSALRLLPDHERAMSGSCVSSRRPNHTCRCLRARVTRPPNVKQSVYGCVSIARYTMPD